MKNAKEKEEWRWTKPGKEGRLRRERENNEEHKYEK